ncbi:unnamed protein product [Moneuplotes crassus]|uniref:Uncharacterized protein n=1 Tax=Euplotes crassus TaxID=5936 RepID=A0AAD1X8Y3_EUPCR|nr:unnamed protein product [Moneuplotes crassus]
MEFAKNFKPIRDQSIQAVPEKKKLRVLLHPVTKISCNVKKKAKESENFQPHLNLTDKKRSRPCPDSPVLDQKALLQKEYNNLRSYISASKTYKGRKLKVSCADILSHTEKLSQSLYNNLAASSMVQHKNIERLARELKRLNANSLTPTKLVQNSQFSKTWAANFQADLSPDCKGYSRVVPISPNSSISGKIFSTMKSERSPQKETTKSRINNSTFYFSQRPKFDVSKRREFLRGLDDYIASKRINSTKKGHKGAPQPQIITKKSHSSKKKHGFRKVMVKRKNKSIFKPEYSFPKRKRLFIDSPKQMGSFQEFSFPSTISNPNHSSMVSPNWNHTIRKKTSIKFDKF